MNAKKLSPAGVVIFYLWRNKFLLILRDDKPEINFPNMWAPVTGGMEEGENICGCAKRESEEEIGIIPKDLRILGISAKGNGFFFGRLTDEEKDSIVLGEGQTFDFFDFEDLSKLKIGGAFKIYLEKFSNIFERIALDNFEPSCQDFDLAIWTEL